MKDTLKPKFDDGQVVTSTDMTRKFSTIRKQAKINPLVITEIGRFDTVILDYKLYVKMYARLNELEEFCLKMTTSRPDNNPNARVFG